jgi:hypothetical protein
MLDADDCEKTASPDGTAACAVSRAVAGSRLSATPETDGLRIKLESYGFKESYVAMLSHARKLEHERDAARKALGVIEERFVDGCDTYDDWRFMGETARAALPPENARGLATDSAEKKS